MVEILTATKIKENNADYFNNPSPELQRVNDAFGKLQEALINPLIKRCRELIKEK